MCAYVHVHVQRSTIIKFPRLLLIKNESARAAEVKSQISLSFVRSYSPVALSLSFLPVFLAFYLRFLFSALRASSVIYSRGEEEEQQGGFDMNALLLQKVF